jgi:hypothetical protein
VIAGQVRIHCGAVADRSSVSEIGSGTRGALLARAESPRPWIASGGRVVGALTSGAAAEQ